MISAKEVREMVEDKRNSELNLELDNVEQKIRDRINDDPDSDSFLFYDNLSPGSIRTLRNLGYTVYFNKSPIYGDDSYRISWK